MVMHDTENEKSPNLLQVKALAESGRFELPVRL